MERDYVLGTHEDELQRLGLQHNIWLPHALKCWHGTGITQGSKVLDIGAGPGYATANLAEIVGEKGAVVGIERSANYLTHLRKILGHKTNVRAYEMDIMKDEIPEGDFDFSWCRWVNSFLSNPSVLIQKNYVALKKGGKAIFHEYVDYETWKFIPASVPQEEFIQDVMKNWRETGSETNAAKVLPQMLVNQGFELEAVRPLVFVLRPHDFMWHWPLSFVEVNLAHQLELGRIEKSWADSVMEAFETRTKDPNSVMITPMMLEIVAVK